MEASSRAGVRSPSSVRRPLSVLLLLALAGPLVFARGIVFPFVVPKAFFVQALVALALVLLAADVLPGREGAPASRLRGVLPRRDPFLWALLAFVLLALVSGLLGESPPRSLLGTLERRWGVLTWASFVGLYLLLRLHLDGDGWKRALRVAVAVATAASLYGLARAAGVWPGQPAPAGWGRISATLGNPGYLASYLALSASLTAYLALRASSGGGRGLCFAALAVQAAALVLTGTRALVLGAGVALVVLAGAWLVLASDRRVRWAAAGGMAALAAAGAAAYLAAASGDPHVPGWWDRLLSALSPEADSVRSRLVVWKAALGAMHEAPLLGAGPENFDLVWSRHFDPEIYNVGGRTVFDRAHNVVVGTAATTGLLGLAAYLAAWAAVGWSAIRAWRREALSGPEASVLAFGASAYFGYLLLWFEDHSSFLAFVLLAGLVGHLAAGGDPPGAEASAGRGDGGSGPPDRRSGDPGRQSGAQSDPAAGRGPGEPDGPPSGLPATVRFGVPALLLALAGALAWHNVRTLDAARNAWNGEYSMDAWEGVEPYRAALARGLPGSEPILQAYLRRLAFLASHGDEGSPEGPSPRMEEAIAAADRALEGWEGRDPENPWVHVHRSRLCGLKENVFGDGTGRACARRALERAVELSPRQIRYRHWLAEHHLSAGDPDRALAVLDEALAVYGSFGETYYYRARVHWRVGDLEEAVRQSRLATSLGWGGQPSIFVQQLAGRLSSEGRPGEAARLVEDHLALRYAELRHPGRGTAPGKGFRPWDLQLAGRLPVYHLRAGHPDDAVRTAEFVAQRLPRSEDQEERRERVRRFVEDVRAGRTAAWKGAESVVEGPSSPEAGDGRSGR